MEEEVRDILRRAVDESPPPKDLNRAIRVRLVPVGGVEFECPEPGRMRPSPEF